MFNEYFLHDRSHEGLGAEWEDEAGPSPHQGENIQTSTQHEVLCAETRGPEGGRPSSANLRRGQGGQGVS